MTTRTIFVGDVHGCLDELCDLMYEVRFRPPEDHLVFLGDLVDRGPDSIKVLRTVRALVQEGVASCIAGNHEEKALRLAEKVEKGAVWSDFSKAEPWHAEATSDDFAWLRQLPLFLRPKSAFGIFAVHGGILPRYYESETKIPAESPMFWHRGGGKSVDRMRRFLRVRHIDNDGNLVQLGEEVKGKTVHWSDWYDGREGFVLYGHDPQLDPCEPRRRLFSIGLDTGCVFGGRLSALVYTDDVPAAYAPIVSVPARARYAEPLAAHEEA